MKTLPNGAIELARRTIDNVQEVVLAVWGNTEFITWNIYFHNDESTGTGHYFTDINEAIHDFNTRK